MFATFAMLAIRGLACKAEGNLSPKDTKPAEGVENAKSFPFFHSAVVAVVPTFLKLMRVVKLT